MAARGSPKTALLRVRDVLWQRHREGTMRSMRSMRGGLIFRSRGPLQKVSHGADTYVAVTVTVTGNLF